MTTYLGQHPCYSQGKRQEDRLMLLLSDGQWRSYYDIITTLKVTNADRRLRHLRSKGVEIEKRIVKFSDSHPFAEFRLADTPENRVWFEINLQLK